MPWKKTGLSEWDKRDSHQGKISLNLSQKSSIVLVMLTFLLVVTLVQQPVLGCILGFRYVPPPDQSDSASNNTRQSCTQCSRAERKPSPRFAFGTAATTPTTPPCCNSGELRNMTGYTIYYNKFLLIIVKKLQSYNSLAVRGFAHILPTTLLNFS